MGRLLAIIGPLCSIAGFVLGRFTKRPSADPDVVRINEHARLLAMASKAYRRNRIGEANIYSEAAERIINRDTDSKELT